MLDHVVKPPLITFGGALPLDQPDIADRLKIGYFKKRLISEIIFSASFRASIETTLE